MIEFISLCVCSACLSCLCCLITGGLCVIPATVRLRNKIVERHFPEEMQWLGNLPPSEVWESDGCGSGSDCGPVSRECPKNRRSSPAGGPEDVSRYRSKECTCVAESRTPRREKKHNTASSMPRDGSKPKGWTFCFRLGKSTGDSGERCAPVEDAENAKGAATTGQKSSFYKKRKKSGTRKNHSETYCAYFKSCSCTNVDEPAKKRDQGKYRGPEAYSAKRPSKRNRDERRSKGSRKSATCPNNCQCKIIAEDEKTLAGPEREREVEHSCKCGAKNLPKTRRRSK